MKLIAKVTLSNRWKEIAYEATDGDIYLDPDTEYQAKVFNTGEGQLIEILDTPYSVTLPNKLGVSNKMRRTL